MGLIYTCNIGIQCVLENFYGILTMNDFALSGGSGVSVLKDTEY